MMHGMKQVLSLITVPLLAAASLAQDIVLQEEVPEIRRYTVEMIIFSYAQDVSTGSEIFVPDEPPPLVEDQEGELADSNILEDPMPVETPELPAELPEIIDTEQEDELVMLPEEDFVLLDIIEKLDTLDAYSPLMHFGWTQPTYPEEETEARPLSSFMTPPEGLEGDLTLYLSRYLHLAVNLQLDAPRDATEEDEGSLTGNNYRDRTANFDDYTDFGDDSVVTYPVRYRIEEDRIFRNGELRYFDHPKFGVLAKITRVEEEEAEPLEEETELLGYDGE